MSVKDSSDDSSTADESVKDYSGSEIQKMSKPDIVELFFASQADLKTCVQRKDVLEWHTFEMTIPCLEMYDGWPPLNIVMKEDGNYYWKCRI